MEIYKKVIRQQKRKWELCYHTTQTKSRPHGLNPLSNIFIQLEQIFCTDGRNNVSDFTCFFVSGFATPPVRRGVFSLTPPPPNQVRSCDYWDQKSTDKRNPLLLPNQLLAQPLTGQEPRSQRPRNTQAGCTQMKKPSW